MRGIPHAHVAQGVNLTGSNLRHPHSEAERGNPLRRRIQGQQCLDKVEQRAEWDGIVKAD